MKNCFILVLVILVISLISPAYPFGEIVTVTGNWSPTASLSGGAGSNMTSTYESASNASLISTTNVVDVPMYINVYRVDGSWNASFHIWVKRTGTGNGNQALTGGGTYQEVTTVQARFFTLGSGALYNLSNVPIQYQLTGVSLGINPANYTTTIYYTITNY